MARGTKQKTLIRRKRRRRELNPKSEEKEKERSANLFISISIDRSPSPSPVDLPSLLDLVFIGNLDSNVTEEELRQIFLQFGEIIYVKIPTSRGCGFVQFIARASAEEAIQRMQGTMIGQQAVHLSWGRSPTAKQDLPGVWSQQADPSQWSSTYYGYGQGYDAYGYGTTHDPSLYAYGVYPGFAQYPQQVEGSQEMASMAGAIPAVEQREEYDPLATPDVDKLNAAYLALPFMEVPFWAGPCGREPHHSHSKQAPMEAPILFVGL